MLENIPILNAFAYRKERIYKIYCDGIERRAQPSERLKKYFQEFLSKHNLQNESAGLPKIAAIENKRQSWGQHSVSSAPTSWTLTAAGGSSSKQRPVEVHGYKSSLLDEGRLCFEEARAIDYIRKKALLIEEQQQRHLEQQQQRVMMIDGNIDEDDLEDVPSLAVAVNPEDLTHISVYRDNTADLKELAKLAQQQVFAPKPANNDKENIQMTPDSIMDEAPPFLPEVEDEDPFEKICPLESVAAQLHQRNSRLSLILEEPELTSTFSISSYHRAVPIAGRILDEEERMEMEKRLNPGLIANLLVVHESALSKVRVLEKCLGRDGVGGNQTISALKLANGHFFVEKRLAPGLRSFLAVDLESECTSTSNQYRLKVVSPPHLWEAYIFSKLMALDSLRFPKLKLCCHYNDVTFLVTTFFEQGTLQKAITAMQGKPDELLLLFYSVELLKILSLLIQAGIVHGRITADHLMTRFSDLNEQWSSQYMPDGSAGWSGKGLALIGFGKSVDLHLAPSASYQVDMLAIKAIIQPLLPSSPKYQSCWQLISCVLDAPINPASPRQLESVITQVDSTLAAASTTHSPSLKSCLTRLEMQLLDSR